MESSSRKSERGFFCVVDNMYTMCTGLWIVRLVLSVQTYLENRNRVGVVLFWEENLGSN